MCVTLFVNVGDCRNDLPEKRPWFGLAQSVAIDNVVEQLAPGTILQDHEDLSVSFNDLKTTITKILNNYELEKPKVTILDPDR